MTFQVAVLPGDGIGPEVMEGALELLDAMAGVAGVSIETSTWEAGGSSIDRHGTPLTEETLAACENADAILLGSVGGPKWDRRPPDQKPERALLRLRHALGLYANVRPAKVYAALAGASSLKEQVLSGTDLVVVRELTGGIYYGEPRGIDDDHGWNTLVYHRHEVERIARFAFELARTRRGKLTSVHKSNVLESSYFWAGVVREVHSGYPDVELGDMYIDNAAMQVVRDPGQFDVIVTQNMFGDIISDITAMITGSMGMLPSASLGDGHALYEPVHGSAPDIAGQGKANPLGMIASVGMMFSATLGRPDIERLLNAAIEEVLEAGYHTPDLALGREKIVSTTEMAELVKETFLKTSEPARAETSSSVTEGA